MAIFNGALILFFLISFTAIITLGRMLKSSAFLRKRLPVFICFVAGVVMMFQFFIPQENPYFEKIDSVSTTWLQIIVSFSMIVGLYNLVQMNFTKISRKAESWPYSVVLLIGFFTTAFIGLREGLHGEHFEFIFNFVYSPMQSTMFSILAFFVASAAFRAFRAKSKEATLLLTAAIIVMLGRVSLGSLIWNHIPIINYLDVSQIAIWINTVFTTAGQRAILLGASLGYIAASFKILLGIERSYFGSEE